MACRAKTKKKEHFYQIVGSGYEVQLRAMIQYRIEVEYRIFRAMFVKETETETNGFLQLQREIMVI